MGLNTTEQSIFGVDVAFHGAGLNYGSSEETALRILKKIFRTIFIMQSYFSNFDKFNSLFVTPKVNPATEKPIRSLLDKARSIISDEMIAIDFISNDEFFTRIVDPTTKSTYDESDTGELFSRTIKLLQLDTRKEKKENDLISNKEQKKAIQRKIDIIGKRTVDDMKIGQFVQFQMKKCFDNNLLSMEEIVNLQNKAYSKNTFNQNFEVLRSPYKEISGMDGRNRYYAREKFCGGYYLTSQWVEYHWEPFLSWLRKINKLDN